MDYKSKYFKYKLKYFKLKQIGGSNEIHQNNDLSIIIDNIQFTLIYKTTTEMSLVPKPEYDIQSRSLKLADIVKIKSLNLKTREETFFWVYRSNSELGIWRFLSHIKVDDPMFYKGIDYVQSSIINIYLQKHILIHYDRLEEIFSPHEDIISIKDNLEYPLINKFRQMINVNQEYINKYNQILDDNLRSVDFFYYPNGPRCGFSGISEEEIMEFIKSMSNSLETHFSFESEEEVFKYNYVFNNIFNCNNTIFKVTLKLKNDNFLLHIYYNKIILTRIINDDESQILYNKCISEITKEGNVHYSVLLAVPYNSYCLNSGMYSYYANLYNYICKPFEHIHQITNPLPNTQCTFEYSYIGYRYANIFPIKRTEK